MSSLVVSDLHLGLSGGADLLREEAHRATLVEALDGVDRLVILGDAIELREVPARLAPGMIAPLLRAAGERVAEIVIVPGNHDHAFIAPWLDARLGEPEDPPPLAPEQILAPAEVGPLAAALVEHAAPAELTFAYPGIWLRPDVYAMHGSYSDLHVAIPKVECIAAQAMARFIAPVPERATPDDYEACLAPLYAFIHALVQRVPVAELSHGGGFSARAWTRLTSGRRRDPRTLALRGGFAGVIGAINRVGLGPLQRDISGPALRRAYLDAIREVARRLGVEADHVIWGHSHRPGPLAGDDEEEWRGILNTGSWVHQKHFLRTPDSPYQPGTAVFVPDSGPPRVRRLLAPRA